MKEHEDIRGIIIALSIVVVFLVFVVFTDRVNVGRLEGKVQALEEQVKR